MNAASRGPRPSALFAIVLILMTIASTVYAGGRKEERLSKIDRLIASRLYNEAIIELAAFIKKSPERFDDAQRRLQRIVRLREVYNSTAGELLNVMVNQPLEDELKLSLIRKLEGLEAAPNRSAREFIARTKETALFTYNRSRFEQIMAEGRTLIDAGAFSAAAKKYAEGFVIYKEEFDAAGYGPLIESRVEGGLQSISAGVDYLGPIVERLNAALIAFEQTLASAPGGAAVPDAAEAYARLEAAFLELASVRNSVTSAGRSFENQFILLQSADKTLTEGSFLPFAFRIVLGRKTEIRPEGIMGAMDTLWIALANRAESSAVSAADRAYKAALAIRSSGNLVSARDAFTSTAAYAELAFLTTGLWSAVAGTELSPALTAYGRSIIGGKPKIALRYRSLAWLAKRAAEAESLAAESAAATAAAGRSLDPYITGASPAEVALAGIHSDRRSLIDLAARTAAAIDQVGVYSKLLSGYVSGNHVGRDAVAYAEDVAGRLAALSRDILFVETTVAAEGYRIEMSELERSSVSVSVEMEKGLMLQSGVAGSEGSVGLKYPAESIPVFEKADAAAGRVSEAADVLLARLAAESPRVVTDSRVAAVVEGARAASAAVRDIRGRARIALTAAQESVRQAEAARQEGERRLSEARSALDRQNFEQARERLQRAGERFDFSLAIQESVSLRVDRDRRLLALSAEIAKTENEVVVRDVRRLITAARRSYFSGVFERAEDLLIQAQNRWKTTNVSDEPEVSYWLALARSALSIKTGRTIPVTAPLFAEMSQLLSFAQRYFEEGRALLNARRKTDALAKFDESRKKIQEVKIVFPINQEASLLSLRIDQLIDPDAFNDSFRRRISDAQAKVKNRPQEAYSELLDLAEINPRYPSLRQLIEKIEIDLGLRLPPPDRAALARSETLSAAARRIVDANLRGQFPVALEQLNEALKLNPNNEQAVVLKDRIQADVGGQAAVVLTNTAEREYQRAVQELQKGNNIVALSIVEQLLRDPQNRNSPRVIELQRRIQSRL